jgi:putative nucleotide binding protein
MQEERDMREEQARVLDFMQSGKAFSHRAEPLAQLLGENWFTILEAQPKPGAIVAIGERVYIGKEEREKISLIKARIGYDELTQTAKNELPNAITAIIKEGEQRFITMINKAAPINIREHSLELLPGVGKKHLLAILKARNEKQFESFADITARVPLLQDPVKLIRDRIISELMGAERFYIFTKPYKPERKY